MSLTVSFSFDTAEEKQRFEQYARDKGMKLSSLAKMSLYQYKARFPLKTAKNEGCVVQSGGVDCTQKPVQREGVGGTGEGVCE